MKTTAITIGMVCAASLCGAADATWMSNPADALWNFTSLYWGAGAAWTDGDNAVFGASETKAITIEEDVAPASVSVTADGYSFDGTVDGEPVNVIGSTRYVDAATGELVEHIRASTYYDEDYGYRLAEI